MKKLLIPVLVVVVLALGCDYSAGNITCTPLLPRINTFNASPSSISPGGTSTLTWNVSGATTVVIDRGIGNVALTGSRAVSPPATTIYTLTATSAGGLTTATAQIVVSGTPAPAGTPVVNSFVATPETITPGGTSTLSWNVADAASVTIDQGIGSVAVTGNTAVSPAATTVYTLTATNPGGSTTASTKVVVSGFPLPPPVTGLPVINYFNASLPIITAGSTTVLGWSVSNATTVNITGIGNVGLAGTAPTSPPVTTTYTLTATNAAGWKSSSITVVVVGAPPPAFAVTSISASVNPLTHTGPCPKMFSFSAVITTNGPGTVTYKWERSDGAIAPIESVVFPAAGSLTVTTSWTLSAEGTRWERLHVLTPNDMVSNQASFTLDCVP